LNPLGNLEPSLQNFHSFLWAGCCFGFVGNAVRVVVLFHSEKRRQQCSSQGSERGYSEKVPTATGFVKNDRVGSLLEENGAKSMLKSGTIMKNADSILLTGAGGHGRVKDLRAYHPLKVGRSPF
jgi:hypothetical protein